MSWLIRSRIRSYLFGVSNDTPPTCTGSAVTPSTPAALIRSTSASGKVLSCPKSTPIRFIRTGDYTVPPRRRGSPPPAHRAVARAAARSTAPLIPLRRSAPAAEGSSSPSLGDSFRRELIDLGSLEEAARLLQP